MPARTVTTLHGRLDLKDLPERLCALAAVPAGLDLRRPAPTARRRELAATVQHGLAARAFTASRRAPQDGYLAFLGRISPEKRPDRAIAIAKRSGLPLKIAAKVDAADTAYFHEVIEPLLDDPLVEFVGEIGDGEKSAFLGNAAALLFPIDWPEPFGLVMIEAMACGTPVVAWRCGSVPEIVDHGETGFIVDERGRGGGGGGTPAPDRPARRSAPCSSSASRHGDGPQLPAALLAALRRAHRPAGRGAAQRSGWSS